MSLLALISMIPLLLLIYDGYKSGNTKKGIFQILIFLVVVGTGSILVKNYGLMFAIFIPSLLVAFVLLTRRKSKE
ncbi:MAG: hypothetical protein H6598_03855 [Flavobacteriales bacterium]|nr:hypothetical protein [Flavobacteriales bacterium]